jgi:hypothetical protein
MSWRLNVKARFFVSPPTFTHFSNDTEIRNVLYGYGLMLYALINQIKQSVRLR